LVAALLDLCEIASTPFLVLSGCTMGSGDDGFLLVSHHIRKLRGGSQPILVQASDGQYYVVKFVNNPQGANVLFNESMGTELYRACKLPVPSWKPLMVTDSSLDSNPACWIETVEGRLRPKSGLCFGSEFLGGGRKRLLEILPGTSFKRVHDRTNFWLAWLLDICAEHADNRQAVFVEDAGGWLDAFFIDHGHLLGGPEGRRQVPIRASRYLDPRIYSDVSYENILSRLYALAALDVDRLWQCVAVIPDEWKSVSAVSSLGRCLDTLARPLMLLRVLDGVIDNHGEVKQGERGTGSEAILRPGVQPAATERPLPAY